MSRFILLAVMVAFLAAVTATIIYSLFGHRVVIWWAKYMRFKNADLEKTTEKVEEILEDEEHAKKKTSSKGRTNKRTD